MKSISVAYERHELLFLQILISYWNEFFREFSNIFGAVKNKVLQHSVEISEFFSQLDFT